MQCAHVNFDVFKKLSTKTATSIGRITQHSLSHDLPGAAILEPLHFRSQVATKEAEVEESGAERRLKRLLGVGTPAPPPPDNDDDVGEANLSEKPWARGMGPDEHYHACAGEGNPINHS